MSTLSSLDRRRHQHARRGEEKNRRQMFSSRCSESWRCCLSRVVVTSCAYRNQQRMAGVERVEWQWSELDLRVRGVSERHPWMRLDQAWLDTRWRDQVVTE